MQERSEQLLDVGTDASGEGRRRPWCLAYVEPRLPGGVAGSEDLVIVDANGYWRQHEVARVVAALEDEPIIWSNHAGRWMSV